MSDSIGKVHSKRTVLPFSWESKTGMSKDGDEDDHHLEGGGDHCPVIKLQPPPCAKEQSKGEELRIPPPPGQGANLQQPLRSSSMRKSLRKNEDPFLIAYIECTKGGGGGGGVSKGHGGFGIRKSLSIFSCKHSSNAIDNSIVRVPAAASKSQRFLKKDD